MKLSELIKDTELTKLRVSDSNDGDYYTLEGDMEYNLSDLLKEKKIKVYDSTLEYSLSNCQGDGVRFTGRFHWKHYFVRISSRTNHYYHSNTVDVELTTNFGYEASKEAHEEFRLVYKAICRQLESWGYSLIEGIQEDDILRGGFGRFCEQYEIDKESTGYEYFDFKYDTCKQDGLIQVCSSGDTILELWIEDFEVKAKHEVIVTERDYYEIVGGK